MRRATSLLAALALATAHSKHKHRDDDPPGPPDPIRHDQAQCLLRGRKVAFIGDSNTRFHFMQFNVFVESGTLRTGRYSKWGEGGAPDFDTYYGEGPARRKQKGRTWTTWYRSNISDSTHRMRLTKTFPTINSSSDYFFAQATWFDGSDTGEKNMEDLAEMIRDYDVVVFNSAWWEIKAFWHPKWGPGVKCGNWSDACARGYAKDVATAVDRLLVPAKAGVWREASCCGDDMTAVAAASVQRMNAIARAAAAEAGVGFVETFDLYGLDNLEAATMDGRHARPEYYQRWTEGVLRAAEEKLRTGCLGRRGRLHVLEGTWAYDKHAAPPFDRYLFSYLAGFHEGFMHRDDKCKTDESWRYRWLPAGDSKSRKLKSSDGLCKALKGIGLTSIGDSLTEQLFETWHVRRVAGKFAVPKGFAEQAHVAASPPHPDISRVAEPTWRAQAGCQDGAAFDWAPPKTPWSLARHEFVASDPRLAECQRQFRDDVFGFNAHRASEQEVWDAVVEAAPLPKRPVLYNGFNDVAGHVVGAVRDCYVSEGADAVRALDLAKRDVVAWWRRELDAVAEALRRAAVRAREERGLDVRVWYRLSPPMGERWIRYGRTHRPLPAGAGDWFRENGGVVAPMPAAHVTRPPPGDDEYGHELYDEFNRMSADAFRSRGHAVLDDVAMMGTRADAHPGSPRGEGDAVHYCLPGPVDYLVDEVVRVVVRSYEEEGAWY